MRCLHVVWLAISLLTTGCTYSVQPIFRAKDLVHDVDLNGVWHVVPRDGDKAANKQAEKSSLEFEGYDENSAYDFKGPGRGQEPQDFVLRVGRLGDLTLAEVTELEREGPPILRGLPVYVFFKLELSGDTLKLHELDDLKCRKLLEQDKLPYFVHLGATKPDIEHTVLTAPTGQMQEFFRKRHAEVFTGQTHVFKKASKAEKKPADKNP